MITCSGGGGGGFYPPESRDPERVLADVRDGIVSRSRSEFVQSCHWTGNAGTQLAQNNSFKGDAGECNVSRRGQVRISIRNLFLFIAFVFTALTHDSAVGATPARKLRMSFAAISGAVAPIWIAKDLGLFEKNGLDVDPVLLQSGPRSVSALLSGEMPVINTGANSAIAANLGGTREPVIIATFYNRLVFSVIGKPEIANISSLKGKVLGVTQVGSLSDFIARLLLAQAGLSPQRDVTLLPTGDYNGMVVSLSKGLIDAGVVSPPSTLKARKLGFREILDVGASGIEYSGTSVATTRTLVRESPDIPRRVVRALVEAIHVFKTDKASSLRVLGRWTRTQDRTCSRNSTRPIRESIC